MHYAKVRQCVSWKNNCKCWFACIILVYREIMLPITVVVISVSESNVTLCILSSIHYTTRDLKRRLHASQLSHTHLTSDCYVYSYELLPNSHKMITICVPFIGLSDLAMNVVDMIYVTIDHCPIRFIL